MSLPDWNPAHAEELVSLVKSNDLGPRHRLLPIGGGTSQLDQEHSAPDRISVRTGLLNRVIDYPARDMTITVEAGMRISDLREILARENQQLPIDIPQAFQATIGGAVASNVCGPSRYGYGTFRDFLIGMTAVDGQGRLFSAGGRVVKNVAGYDLCKLMIGSQGTLGILTQVTLKLTPLPEHRSFVLVRAQQVRQLESVLSALNLSTTRPVILELLNAAALEHFPEPVRQLLPVDPFLLCIGYAGTRAETDWQMNAVLSEVKNSGIVAPLGIADLETSSALSGGLTEFATATEHSLCFQASMLPSQVPAFTAECSELNIAVSARAGNGQVIGIVSERLANPEAMLPIIQNLRNLAQSSGGSLVVTKSSVSLASIREQLRSPLAGERLIQKIKETFDPKGILNPAETVR